MADPDKGTDKLSGDQSLRASLGGVPSKSIEAAPWYVKAGFLFLSMVGIPGALVAVREVKDWRFEERRLVIEQQRIEAQAKQNVMLEELSKTLKEIKWRLPKENSGGNDR